MHPGTSWGKKKRGGGDGSNSNAPAAAAPSTTDALQNFAARNAIGATVAGTGAATQAGGGGRGNASRGWGNVGVGGGGGRGFAGNVHVFSNNNNNHAYHGQQRGRGGAGPAAPAYHTQSHGRGRGSGGGGGGGRGHQHYVDPSRNYHNHSDHHHGRGGHFNSNRGGGRGSGGGGGGGRGAPFGGRGRAVGGGGTAATSAFANNGRNAQAERFNAHDESTWRTKDFERMILEFLDSPGETRLAFPPSLTPAQRYDIHKLGMKFNLPHESTGEGAERFITLLKPQALEEQRASALDALARGERVKTIDGYQGAQLLPCEFLDDAAVPAITESLRAHELEMYREIHVEANRPSAGARRFHLPQPGLPQPPRSAVPRERHAELQRYRKGLPAYRRKGEIVAAVRDNSVVVLCGDTGSGKTTQIPQMLHDAHFLGGGSIVCTQPRRISALSVAHRVAEERGEACGDSCGYIIRFDNTTSRNTRIVYQTTGILLRRLHSEPELRGVDCVIVDEVHERDVETDFVLLLLRDRLRAQQQHPERFPTKLRVVVMSATIQIQALVQYFSDCNGGRAVPLVNIPGTLFPVEEYFLEEAMAWAGVDPRSVPTMRLIQRRRELREESARAEEQKRKKNSGGGNEKEEEAEDAEDGSNGTYDKLKAAAFSAADFDAEALVPFQLISSLIVHLHRRDRDVSGSILVFLPGWSAISRVADDLRRSPVARELSVLMLHSSLTTAEQQRVFLPAPRRFRKVVLATSIAETSITIDDIVYVVDSGLMKGTSYDPSGNTSALRATLIGKANGVQRRGRAGRCRAGTCVHLLPREVYEEQPDFLPPQITRSPLEEVCLQIKAVCPDERCGDVLQRALDPPPAAAVAHATRFLTDVGALTEAEERLTNLGRALAQLPVHPLLGKMLFAAACFGVLDTVATIAAGLSIKSPFPKPQPHERAAAEESRQRLDQGDLSDHLCVVKLYEGWVRSGRSYQFAAQYYADPTLLRTLERTKRQLERLVLQSPLARGVPDAAAHVSRHARNYGLVRLVMLWSLYPRLATMEYRANRSGGKPVVFCLDNKPAVFSLGSVLVGARRAEIQSRDFVVYYERIQLESQLNLSESSCVSPLDVALCLRELSVYPLARVPDALLTDEKSKLAPSKRLDLARLEPRSDYAAMFFDGDKKLYVARRETAAALQTARQCMDYYLALCIKKLRADVFPTALLATIADLIGYPITEATSGPAKATAGAGGNNSGNGVDDYEDEEERLYRETHNLPAFARGPGAGDDDNDDNGDEEDEGAGPIIEYEDEEGGPDLGDDDPLGGLSEEQRRRVIAALGDLAIFRSSGASELLRAAAAPPPIE